MLEVLRYIALNAFNCVHTKIKAMSKVSQRYATDFNALNAMYVEDVEDGVCSFYATLHRELLILFLMLKVSKMSNNMNN